MGLLAASTLGGAMSLTPVFDYDPTAPLAVRDISVRSESGVTLRNLTFAPLPTVRRAAYLVTPETGQPTAAILFVHWYETWAANSNRRQFLEDAKHLAQRGTASLLVETLWSDDDWFYKRTQQEDQAYSIQQVIELRRALDLLLAQTGVAPAQLAYVGHDFGAMYGVLMASVEMRPSYYVLMAGTPRFSDWYLYYPPMTDEARQSYIAASAAIDPITHIAKLSPKPVLFQFGTDDQHVSKDRAEAFYAAAVEPKDAGTTHRMN
jgi:dienelactone hydrolase